VFALRDLSVYQNIITRWKLVIHENKKGDNGEFMDAEISAGNFGQSPAAGENFP